MQGSWMPCVILLLENKVSLAFWAHPRLIDRVLLNALALRPLLVFVMRSPFGWQSGCLSSMGGPAGMGRNARIRECANGERSSEVLECVRQAVFRATPLFRSAKKRWRPAAAGPPHSSPAMSREPRLCRACSSVAPPFIRWPAPSRGAGLFCCCKVTDILRSIRVIVRHPRKVALTAAPASCSGLPVNARSNIRQHPQQTTPIKSMNRGCALAFFIVRFIVVFFQSGWQYNLNLKSGDAVAGWVSGGEL